MQPNPDKQLRSAYLWMLISSVALCWLPGLGAFLAGWVGGRGRKTLHALQAAIVVGLFWSVLLFILGGREWKVGAQSVEIPPLKWMGFAYLVAMCGGAFSATLGGKLRIAGIVLGLVGITGVAPAVNEILAVGKLANQVLTDKYDESKNKTCPDNLKQLYNATMLYSDSYDGTLPPADRWMDAIKDNVPKDAWLHCPDLKSGYGYAMNTKVGGKKLSEFKERATIPLFFESTKTERNANDDGTSRPNPGRHMGKNNFVNLDGTVGSGK